MYTLCIHAVIIDVLFKHSVLYRLLIRMYIHNTECIICIVYRHTVRIICIVAEETMLVLFGSRKDGGHL